MTTYGFGGIDGETTDGEWNRVPNPPRVSLKRGVLLLELPERRLVGLPILGRQMVNEEDAMEVVVLVLGGA